MSSADTSPRETNIGKGRIGTIYAKAFLGVAEPTGRVAELVQELEDFVTHVLCRFQRFDDVLSSPRLSPEEKQNLLDRTLGPKTSSELLRFLKVVCQHGRM